MLEISNLRVRYGAVEALRGISLEVREGEMVALIGSNGAGKSTCLKSVAGPVRPVQGSIRFRGRELAGEPAHRIVAQGISLVPEGRRLFADQTVMDNLLLGAYRRRMKGGEKNLRAQAQEHLQRFPILLQRRDLPAGGLSGGEQQMLAISRGLMAMPHLLLLDEPSLGLAPRLVRQIFGIITALRQEGRTILLVEQMASLALRAADRAYVLEHGQIVLEGPAQELLVHPDIARAYLGRRAPRT
jgi:branched-chain amino acid transport system ATP-binding protein